MSAPGTSPSKAAQRSFALRLLDGVSLAFNHVGTLLIVAAMILVTSDVIGRGVFNQPVRGVPEMVGASIVAIVFLQISHALRSGRMIRSDSLLHWAGRRHPRWAHAIEGIFALLGALLFVVIVHAAIPLVQEAVRSGTFIGAQGFFTMPIWPVKTVVVIGCVVMVLQYLRLAWDKFRHAAARAPWHGDVPE